MRKGLIESLGSLRGFVDINKLQFTPDAMGLPLYELLTLVFNHWY